MVGYFLYSTIMLVKGIKSERRLKFILRLSFRDLVYVNFDQLVSVSLILEVFCFSLSVDRGLLEENLWDYF